MTVGRISIIFFTFSSPWFPYLPVLYIHRVLLYMYQEYRAIERRFDISSALTTWGDLHAQREGPFIGITGEAVARWGRRRTAAVRMDLDAGGLMPWAGAGGGENVDNDDILAGLTAGLGEGGGMMDDGNGGGQNPQQGGGGGGVNDNGMMMMMMPLEGSAGGGRGGMMHHGPTDQKLQVREKRPTHEHYHHPMHTYI